MKRITATLLLAVSLVCLLVSCTGTTPDAAKKEAEAAVTVDNLNWSIAVEGASKDAYTISDAKAHDISKGIVSMWLTVTGGNTGSKKAANRTSFIAEGVKFSEFLADVGASDATTATFSGTDIYGSPFEYTMNAEEMNNEKVLLAWIYNKKDVFPDSLTYVGIVDGSGELADFGNCLSVEKIVIG